MATLIIRVSGNVPMKVIRIVLAEKPLRMPEEEDG